MSYRFDTRTKEQFIEEIATRTAMEQVLMQRYVAWLNTQNKGLYTFVDNGIDNTGAFIEDDKKVKAVPDFVLYKNGTDPKRIEIKHCLPERAVFHLKTGHVNKCIKDDVCIVNWMGVDAENPRFCILTPEQLKLALTQCKHVKFWSKPCLQFKCNQQSWITGV